MKKLTVFLCVLALLFCLLGNANSATLNMTMNTLVADIGPHVTSEFNFTIEVDDTTGDVLGWTDFMSNYFYASEAGGNDPRAGNTPFTAGQQIYPNGVYQSVSTAFDGDTSAAGTTLWFRGLANSDGPFAGLMFNWGLLQFGYDPMTRTGFFDIAPKLTLSEHYTFRACAVPIPDEALLLGSGFIWLVGARRKFRKEVS